MFILDTDHLSVLQHDEEPAVAQLLRRMDRFERTAFFVTDVSFHEQAMGWNNFLSRARTTKNVIHGYRMYRELLDEYATAQLLPFDEAAAIEFDAMSGTALRVGLFDRRIAAIALTRKMTVLSRNLKDFQRIPNLRVEDWTTNTV